MCSGDGLNMPGFWSLYPLDMRRIMADELAARQCQKPPLGLAEWELRWRSSHRQRAATAPTLARSRARASRSLARRKKMVTMLELMTMNSE